MAQQETSRGRGRPKVTIDLDKVKQLAMLGCTLDEIALVLGIGRRTLFRRKAEMQETLDVGYANMKLSLRRYLFRGAQNGNPALAIFLAKNFLGMRDNFSHEVSGPAGAAITIHHEVDPKERILRKLADIAQRSGAGLDLEPTDER